MGGLFPNMMLCLVCRRTMYQSCHAGSHLCRGRCEFLAFLFKMILPCLRANNQRITIRWTDHRRRRGASTIDFWIDGLCVKCSVLYGNNGEYIDLENHTEVKAARIACGEECPIVFSSISTTG
jgi:hypothetical protein